MAAQTAQIIDLDQHRKARRGDIVSDRPYGHQHLIPSMVMVPVWFVPAVFIGMQPDQG